MRRSAPVLAIVLVLGLTGCHHGSRHHNAAAARPAPSPYTTGAVQRAFARAGLPMRHDRATEAFARESESRSTLAAFLTDKTGNVQVSVYRPSTTGELEIQVRAFTEGEQQFVTKTPGNLSVTYPTLDPGAPRVSPSFAPRVLRALALLRKARRPGSAQERASLT